MLKINMIKKLHIFMNIHEYIYTYICSCVCIHYILSFVWNSSWYSSSCSLFNHAIEKGIFFVTSPYPCRSSLILTLLMMPQWVLMSIFSTIAHSQISVSQTENNKTVMMIWFGFVWYLCFMGYLMPQPSL